MPNRFQIKRTSTSGRTPNTTSSGNTQYIAAGEFGLNMTDQILYTSDGTNLITVGANLVNQRVSGNLSFTTNSKRLTFTPLAGGSNVYFSQQNDDNFVFYSTNTTNGERPVWSIFANSITSNLQIQIPLQPLTGIVANSTLGTAGQTLTSNGTGVYWATGAGTGTVTQVNTGIGLSGGPISSTGTISVVPNTGIIANATGVYVNSSYIATISANAATYLNGKTEGNLNVNNSTTSSKLSTPDTRAVATTPETLAAPGIISDFKQNTTEGLSDGGTYFGELTFRPYGSTTDWSGGPSHQLAFTTNNNMYFRSGTSTTWGSWKKIIDSSTNSTLSGNIIFSANVTMNGLIANGAIGTAGQVLHSDGTKVYWAADDNAGGTVTSVATGNGMTGGTFTTTGTVSVLANTGIVANATGVFVNSAYIATISANAATYLNGKTEGNLNVNNATQLATTRTINGVNFNGTANILVPSLYDANYRRITNPGGAEYNPGTASVTGAIEIVLPVGWTNSMMRMTVKIFDYAANKSFDVTCGGYNYVTSTAWINTFAYILADKDEDRRFTVRFGFNAAGKCVIYIGELASTWSYPQVYVTDVQVGHSGQSATWVSGWTIGAQATAFENVTSTVTSTQVGYGTSTSTADALVLRDASSNFAANTITANLVGSTVNAVTSVNSALLTVGTSFIANTTGAYHTGVVNGASHTVGSNFIANSTAIVGTGFANITTSVNSALLTVGTAFIANSTAIVGTGFANITTSVNSALLTVGTSFIANTTGAYHTGVVNGASHTVGSSFIANSTAIVGTGFANITTSVNSALLTVGTAFIANSTAIVGTGYANITTSVNSAAHTVGTAFIANATGVYHTGVVNAASHTVGSVFIANTTQLTTTVPFSANGSTGTSGFVLTSNGATGSPYWAVAGGVFATKSANYTAVNGDRLLCNTAAGTFTVTLPATPATGATILIYDISNFTTNPLTVARNGSTIESVADDFSLDIGQTRSEFIYDGGTWHVYSSIGPRGLPGTSAPSSVAYSIALG